MIRFTASCLFMLVPFFPVYAEKLGIGRIDGTKVRVKLSLQQIVDSPEWNANDSDEPPLDVATALKLAKSALAKKHPRFVGKRWTIHISLRPLQYFDPPETDETVILTDRWVYWIRFIGTPPVGNGITLQLAPDVPVAVLMDRTAIVATKTRNAVNHEGSP